MPAFRHNLSSLCRESSSSAYLRVLVECRFDHQAGNARHDESGDQHDKDVIHVKHQITSLSKLDTLPKRQNVAVNTEVQVTCQNSAVNG